LNNTSNDNQLSRTAAIRQLAKTDRPQAITQLIAFLQGTFDLTIDNLQVNDDQYSLNSLNGFFEAGGAAFFFKFHQEDGEEDMKGEYYRAEIIADAGLPIDMPVMTSTLPGEQILVYKRRNDNRFSDVLLDLDITPDVKAEECAAKAEAILNKQILEVALRTLHPVTASQVREEPIHHLFFDRMLDLKSGVIPGGRYKDFYVDETFVFPGVELHWREFSQAKLVVNGQSMRATFGEVFEAAARNLHPDNLANAGGFTAHGDAHNANVWFETSGTEPTLSYFDPAFAGEHIPSLLAEAKATFHNAMAHPLWLYNAEDAASIFQTEASYKNNVLSFNSNWSLSPVRRKLLDAKIEHFWKPFLAHLAKHNLLPDTWQRTLRSALAMCPALVMNLRANADRHNPTSSAIAFSLVALCGSEPETGPNLVTDFLDRINPSLH
jgi:hypothetical protein